jgi:hypothetical protein
MPRLVFEEPKGGPAKREPVGEQRENRRDNVVLGSKIAMLALVVALAVAGVLLLTSRDDEPRAQAPSVPEITTSPAPTTDLSVARMVAPEVRSQTAVITATAAPTTTTTAVPPRPPKPGATPPGQGDQFAVIGRPCDTAGAYAFTQRYEPVMCAGRRGGKLAWRPVFE